MNKKQTSFKINRVISILTFAVLLGLSGCGSAALTDVGFDESEMVIMQGQSINVAPKYSFSNETPTEKQISSALEKAAIKWQSSDEAVASVDASGAVTAKAAGTAVITVADGKGSLKADLKVTVIVPVKEVTAEKEITLDLFAAQTGKMGLKITPENASEIDVVYKSGNENIAIVNGKGTIMPIAEGEVEITAEVTSASEKGKVKTTVKTKVIIKKLPQEIELEQGEGILYVGGKVTLKPYTLPEGAPESTYTFASSDEKVATADEKGVVTAKGAGKCEITVTSAEGHTAVYALTVNQAPKAGGGKAGAAEGTTGKGGGTTGATGGGTGGGTTPPATPTTPTPPSNPNRVIIDGVEYCVNVYGTGHVQVGVCPVCGCSNGGIYEGGSDGQGIDGLS